MDRDEIIQALRGLIREENETERDVYYNEGVIDAIKKVEALALRSKAQQVVALSYYGCGFPVTADKGENRPLFGSLEANDKFYRIIAILLYVP
jgi:adenylate cyclase class IV